MPRLPHGARVFTEQVQAMRKSAKFEVGEADGLGTARTVQFDKATSKWLEPILDQFNDPRIVGYGTQKDQLTIMFSERMLSENKDPFPLEAAKEVADDAKS